VSPFLLCLREALAQGIGDKVTQFGVGALTVEVRATTDSVWAIVRREGRGGIALRAAHLTSDFQAMAVEPEAGEIARIEIVSTSGEHRVVFGGGGDGLENLRVTTSFRPAARILVPYAPRDLYPLDADDDPLGAEGEVEATQRGLNSGLIYFRMGQPAFGRVLYFQNLTALNGYFHATGTTPKDAVGGKWPELGYLMPTPGDDGSGALEAGVEVTLSDAILVFRPQAPSAEQGAARQFLQMLAAAYRMLDVPRTTYHDWIERSERTLRDLDEAPAATIRHYGHRYIHPYTASEYPDSMVQMSVTAAIHDWGKWRGEPHPLEAEFMAGMRNFFDPELKTLRRYLPNVGDDKDADAVDSWYLYHPLLNLANLALDGDEGARRLFMESIDFGIKAAHHFNYEWPIQYNVTDFSLITETAPADGKGQTDVGGIYAWVMLQAYELTGEDRFLKEARAALDAAMGLRFNLNYQANLTAWGAAGCMRLWRITNEEVYREESYVYLASFFHNTQIWKSEIGHAQHYSNFLAVTCLQDAPYMAMYECFESFAAFERYLDESGPDLDPAARLLVSEFCKYVLDRAWFYYPDALPKDAISEKQRESNGYVDRELSFPLEDLYPDGQPAGQVGQEIYGAGAAFILATRAVHELEGAPFRVFCNQFVRSFERTGDKSLTITLNGGDGCSAQMSLLRKEGGKVPAAKITTAGGDVPRPHTTCQDRIDFYVPATGSVTLLWE
jgi:hypothetical protein